MSSNYQERFWRELDQLKVHVYYLELYLEKTERIERGLNIILAIASSGSIAGWAIWQKYQIAWAFVIALSQLIHAIKPHLPFSKRLKALNALTNDLESLFLSMENHWFNVSEGRLSEEEIHKLHMQIKGTRRQLIQKHIGSESLPKNGKLLAQAVTSTKTYFLNFYSFQEQPQ